MFAHQVIEDIPKLITKTEESAKKNGLMCSDVTNLHRKWSSHIPFIKKAQKFHMGDLSDMRKFRTPPPSERLFDPNLCRYMKLPYKLIWLDFTAQENIIRKFANTKEAILVSSVTDTFWFAEFFTFIPEMKSWVPAMISCIVLIGGPTEENINLLKLMLIERDKAEREQYFRWADTGLVPFVYTQQALDNLDGLMNDYHLHLELLQTSVTLLNCKNIQTEKIPPPERLNKERRKSGKQELFDYYVLNIFIPSKKQGYREKTEPLSHNRIHLCRGHFKEYTTEHPLLGRFTGLYWWQPHVRGQNKDGIVMKDYSVKSKQIGEDDRC
jgi:hypothetical protein